MGCGYSEGRARLKMKYKYDLSAEKEFKRVAVMPKPRGFIVFDSFNNEWFPLSTVTVDKTTFNLRLLKDEFHRTYGGSSYQELFMPFHYSVELIGKNYYCTSTRPINYKSLIPGYEEYISICIVGDSNLDIYSPDFYKVIAHTVMNPLHYIQGWRLNPADKTTFHNLGSGFKEKQLEKNFR